MRLALALSFVSLLGQSYEGAAEQLRGSRRLQAFVCALELNRCIDACPANRQVYTYNNRDGASCDAQLRACRNYGCGDDFVFHGGVLTLKIDNPNGDNDGDGLTNQDEEDLGTDPNNSDTDRDGVNDFDEVNQFQTNPFSANEDKDGDGLLDQVEILEIRTDPNLFDTDGDGVDDGDEVENGINPFSSDTDGDSISDFDELTRFFSDPNNPIEDNDGDGLLNPLEIILLQTDPNNRDTDGDGVDDYDEYRNHRTDPLNPDTVSTGSPSRTPRPPWNRCLILLIGRRSHFRL